MSEPADVFNEKRWEAERSLRVKLNNIDSDEREFNQLVANYKENPLIIVDIGTIGRFKEWYKLNFREVTSAIAKEKGWLEVTITEYNRRDIYLFIPNKPGVQKLVSGLLLIAQPINSAAWNAECTVEDKPRSWQFRFKGEGGRDILERWIEQCRTDQLYQMVLKFGPMFTRREK